MKYLITGASGFIGKALAKTLLEKEHTVHCLARKWTAENQHFLKGAHFIETDINENELLKNQLKNLLIDGVFHLAGQSSVKLSWKNPFETFQANLSGTLALIEALKQLSPSPKLLHFSSGEVYGIKQNLTPNPYALSKKFSEEICKQYYPNHTIIRQFSVIGPKQKECFAIPSFCRQVAEMIANKKELVLHVGNLNVERRFLDLNDAIKAYLLIMANGKTGALYDIGGEKNIPMKTIIMTLQQLSGITFDITEDKTEMRPSETQFPDIHLKPLYELGWKQETPIEKTLKEILNCYMELPL